MVRLGQVRVRLGQVRLGQSQVRLGLGQVRLGQIRFGLGQVRVRVGQGQVSLVRLGLGQVRLGLGQVRLGLGQVRLERKGGGGQKGRGGLRPHHDHNPVAAPTPLPHAPPLITIGIGCQTLKDAKNPKKKSQPLTPPPINRRFSAFFVSFTYLYIPPTSPQIFAQCSHKCAKFFHMECNDAHMSLSLPDTSHTQKRNFRPRTYDKKSINRTIGMLVKHLLKFAQYSKV